MTVELYEIINSCKNTVVMLKENATEKIQCLTSLLLFSIYFCLKDKCEQCLILNVVAV